MRGKAFIFFVALSLALCGSFTHGFSSSYYKVEAESTNCLSTNANKDVTKERSYTSYIYIDSLENIASLNISVHFDPTVLTVNGTYNIVSSYLYDSSINNDNISYSYIFETGGSDSKTSLFRFTYSILSTCPVTSSFFDILVDDAYDFDLNVVEIEGLRHSFNIAEPEVVKTTTVYGNSAISTSMDKQFTLSYRFSNYQIASGTIDIQYDRDLFEYVSLEQLGFLSNMMVDINTSLDSDIRLSFVGSQYPTNDNILNIVFRTIDNVDVVSQIKFVTSGLCDLDLVNVSCSGYTTNVTVSHDSEYDVLPEVSLSSTYDSNNNQVTVSINLAEESHLGAGDFELGWNVAYLEFVSYEKRFSPTFFTVNDKQTNNGVLKFSIISMTDIVTANEMMEVVFDVINPHDETSVPLTISGTGLADSLTNPISLSFVGCSQVVPGVHFYGDWSVVKQPTCTEEGSEHRVCSVCEHEEVRAIEALGHDYSEEWTIDVPATCTHAGSKSHHCSRCDSKIDVTAIPMLDHTPAAPVQENVVASTCTEAGSYDSVVYCSECGTELSSEHIVVPALGHSYGDWEVTKNPTCTEEGSEHRICSVCGHEDIRAIEALGHNYSEEWTIDVEPTYDHEGSKSHHCSRCDSKTDVTVIPAIDRNPAADAIEENCVTTPTLSYHYEKEDDKYTFTNVMIRFRGIVDQEYWEALTDVTGYGAMLSTEEVIGENALKSYYGEELPEGIQNFITNKTTPAFAEAENYDFVDKDSYIWNLRVSVNGTDEKLVENYVAVTYITTQKNGTIFLGQVTASVKSIAQALLETDNYNEESLHGSLYYLAHLGE